MMSRPASLCRLTRAPTARRSLSSSSSHHGRPIPLPLTPASPAPAPPVVTHLTSPSDHSTTVHFAAPHPPVTLPNLYLRTSSLHPSHRHSSSGQKLRELGDYPTDGKVMGWGVVPAYEGAGECVVMEWETEVKGLKMGDEGRRLSVVRVEELMKVKEVQEGQRKREWDVGRLKGHEGIEETTYGDYMRSDGALLGALDSLAELGITIIRNVPTTEREGSEKPALRGLVERVGEVRRTWYGDLWDVRAEEGSRNIAYTDLELGLHMDLTCVDEGPSLFHSIRLNSTRLLIHSFFIPILSLHPHRHLETPPRYQFLHSLLNSSISGGLSYFVDSYHLISLLRAFDPQAYHTLCTTPVLFEYRDSSKGIHTRFVRPTIELDAQGAVTAVNYSPPFMGNLLLPSSSSTIENEKALVELHRALSLFADLAAKEENTFRIQLEEGDCVAFDNRRVLHARTAFTFVERAVGETGEDERERGRWLKGAYLDLDWVESRRRVLRERGSGRK